ncbi:uracil-DNA glycosylase [Sphingomonas abietis]|uniref:Type-5 uracil-DNA glycosylase n=1 Tax=Sphingomonas abietis TaxID=3012344 RepID=A0ABY7NPN6_9SPHN|nr:uracil-DNA glycosylase [Sphingomonas abietis]WBO23509.1 uracil-DNA glycosylase [Sphingomonas abietis]
MTVETLDRPAEPPADCALCPRLADFRHEQQLAQPDWFNAPVPSFGDPEAWLAIVGLAPGLHGAHRTGRPFTGDGAGTLLYGALATAGLSEGVFANRPDDGLRLNGAIIVNAVRCVPPQNRPTPEEIRTCRPFLETMLRSMPNLRVVVALGQIAHQSAVKALGGKLPKLPFGHGAEHRLHTGPILLDSYHCSRYNQNTGRLTAAMFEAIFARAVELRESGAAFRRTGADAA